MKFTHKHARQVRAAARIETGFARVSVEAGTRFNTETGAKSVNIAAISADPEWNDTDLDDYLDLVQLIGKEIADQAGRVHIDFYVSDPRTHELESNVDLIWEDGELVSARGTTKKEIKLGCLVK